MTELPRTGARRLIEAAVAAEFEEFLTGFADERLPDGRQRVVRNGHFPRREILTGIGGIGRNCWPSIDSTVTETHILEPADSRLLTRLLDAAREQLGADAVAFHDHRRAVKRRALEIQSQRGA